MYQHTGTSTVFLLELAERQSTAMAMPMKLLWWSTEALSLIYYRIKINRIFIRVINWTMGKTYTRQKSNRIGWCPQSNSRMVLGPVVPILTTSIYLSHCRKFINHCKLGKLIFHLTYEYFSFRKRCMLINEDH